MASLWVPKGWNSNGVQIGLYGDWGRTVHPSFLIAFWVSKLCGLVHFHVEGEMQ
jgi:hypothetical protein